MSVQKRELASTEGGGGWEAIGRWSSQCESLGGESETPPQVPRGAWGICFRALPLMGCR